MTLTNAVKKSSELGFPSDLRSLFFFEAQALSRNGQFEELGIALGPASVVCFPEVVFTAFLGEVDSSEEQQQHNHELLFSVRRLVWAAGSSGQSEASKSPASQDGCESFLVGILTGFLVRQISSQKLFFLGSINFPS